MTSGDRRGLMRTGEDGGRCGITSSAGLLLTSDASPRASSESSILTVVLGEARTTEHFGGISML